MKTCWKFTFYCGHIRYQLGNIPVWQHHDIIDWRYKVVHWTEQILSLESVHCPLLPQSVLSLPRGRAKQHQVSSVKRRPAITGSKSFLLRNPGEDLKWINDTGENVNIINEKLSFTRFEMINKFGYFSLQKLDQHQSWAQLCQAQARQLTIMKLRSPKLRLYLYIYICLEMIVLIVVQKGAGLVRGTGLAAYHFMNEH